MGFLILAAEGLESFLLAAEFQNSLDTAILKWSVQAHHRGLLLEPITEIEGAVKHIKNKEINPEKVVECIAARRTFELVYYV